MQGDGASTPSGCMDDVPPHFSSMQPSDHVVEKEHALHAPFIFVHSFSERMHNCRACLLPKRMDEHVPHDPSHEYLICHITQDQLHLLWHVQFAHMHSCCVAEMHKHATVVPKVAVATDLDTCPACANEKIKKTAQGKEDYQYATVCGQGVSIDMVFMVQTSLADSKWVECIEGINGETSYCLITGHRIGCLFGGCSISKAPLLHFIHHWLSQPGCSSNVPDKCMRMDLGGELGHSHAVCDCFENAGTRLSPLWQILHTRMVLANIPMRSSQMASRQCWAAQTPPIFWLAILRARMASPQTSFTSIGTM